MPQQIVPGFQGGGLQPDAPSKTPPPPGPVPDQHFRHPKNPAPPSLANIGFVGSIGDFNYKVQQAVHAHQAATGTKPSPGLVLDVVRSQVPVARYPSLFQVVAGGIGGTLHKAATAISAAPGNLMIQRPDGMLEPNHIVRQLAMRQSSQPAQNAPWIPQGYLPIQDFNGFVNGVQDHNTIGGLTIQQYQSQVQEATKAAIGSGTQMLGPGDPGYEAMRAQSAQLHGVVSIKAGQQELQKLFPDQFADLPATGVFNDDWARRIVDVQKTEKYVQLSTVRIAKENHFDNPQDFIKAWQARNEAINSDPYRTHIWKSVPLAFYGDGQSVLNYFTGGTHGWGYANVPTVALHTLTGVARLGFDVIGGTWEQTKADASAMNKFLHGVLPSYLGGEGQTFTEANAAATALVQKNPSWVRVLYPDASDATVNSTLGQVANLTGDILLGSKITLGAGGGYIKAGNPLRVVTSWRANARIKLAFNTLAKHGTDGVSDASRALLGGEKLNTYLAPAVKDGTVSFGQYRQAVAELYAHGHATVGDITISGEPVLSQFRVQNLPVPSANATKLHQAVRTHLNEYDASLRSSRIVGTDNVANMFSSLRQLVGKAAPSNERRVIFDANTPAQIQAWVVKNLQDPNLAQTVRNDFVVARAQEDFAKIKAIEDNLRERYATMYPGKKFGGFESTGPQIASESYTYMFFPGGGIKDATGPLTAIQKAAQSFNQKLNTVGQWHRRVIISGAPIPGGESLFWKHAVADTLRRAAGGGGVNFGLGGALKKVQQDVQSFLAANPEHLRTVGVSRASTTEGEFRWLTHQAAEAPQTFNTGEQFASDAHMVAAGGYLRNLISDKALKAYRNSNANDLSPLVDLVLSDRFYRMKLEQDPALIQQLSEMKGASPRDILNVRRSYAAEHAQALYNRYREFEHAAQQAGVGLTTVPGLPEQVADPFSTLTELAASTFGPKGDKAIGDWVKTSQIDFPVRDGLVQRVGRWDGLMQAWVGRLMTFNKLNRKAFWDHAFYNAVNEFRKAGWNMADAVPIASDIARKQAVYHMLDFSNMLQLEQNLRWLSYFATKHRLYQTWILRQELTHPAQVGAINDIRQHLDDKGNLPFQVGGHRLLIPAARLVWANSTEYPETSPPVELAARFGKNVAGGQTVGNALANGIASMAAASGNVLSRQDQAMALFASAATNASYYSIVQYLPAGARAAFNRRLHTNILAYRDAHHGQYPDEQSIVRATVLQSAAYETWRTNLFLPVLSDTSNNPAQQKLLDEFSNIRNPGARRKFLDAHPAVVDLFGASGDQHQYLHEAPLWDDFNRLRAAHEQQLQTIYERVLANGFTVDDAKELKAVGKAYTAALDQIKLRDANTWSGSTTYPKGQVKDGVIVTPGPWTVKLEGDPFATRAFVHEMFPNIPAATLDAGTVGQRVIALRQELVRLREFPPQKLGYADAHQVKYRVNKIYAAITAFNGYPRTAMKQLQDKYYNTFVAPYIHQRELRNQEIALLPIGKKDVAEAEFRAWRDQHDHPVYLEATPTRPTGTLFVIPGNNPGLLSKGTIDLNHRPAVQNSDGTISSVRSITITENGKAILLPTVVGDRVVSNQAAIAQYRKTGQHLGVFLTEAAANKYAQRLHIEQANMYTAHRVKFPSVVQIGWGLASPVDVHAQLAKWAGDNWGHIASYEKTMLGVKTDPVVSDGWSQFQQLRASWKADPNNSGHNLDRVQIQRAAHAIDRGNAQFGIKPHPGFYKDYLFSLRPKILRYKATNLYLDMPSAARTEFDSLVGQLAEAGAKLEKQPGYSTAVIRDRWKLYIDTHVIPALGTPEYAALKKELAVYAPDFLYTLVSK